MAEYFATDSDGGLIGLINKKIFGAEKEEANHWEGDSYGWWE